MALEVNWSEGNLEDLIPDFIQDLEAADFGGLADLYANLKKAEKAVAAVKFAQAAIDAAGVASAEILALTALIDLANDAITDFVNTGIYFLAIPPLTGDTQTFSNYIRSALLNQRDPRRPVFSSTATIMGFGGFAFSVDNFVTELAFDSIKKGIISKEDIQRALDIRNLPKRDGLSQSYFKNVLAGTARPIKDSPWAVIKISDIVPGLEDVAISVKSFLLGLKNSVQVSALQSYLNFAQRYVNNVTAIIESIKSTIDFLKNSLDSLPLRIFDIPPAVGGTVELSLALSGFFDPSEHTELQDVGAPIFITGFFIMAGTNLTADSGEAAFNVGKASVEAKYDVLKILFDV